MNTPLRNLFRRLRRLRPAPTPSQPDTAPSPDTKRTFTFLATASTLVTITAPDEHAARAAYEELNQQEFAIDFTTEAGSELHAMTLEDHTPDLYWVDGVEPVELCPATPDCIGYRVNGQCTEPRCPTLPLTPPR